MIDTSFARGVAESMMTDRCTVSRPAWPSVSPTTANVVGGSATTVASSVPCSVQGASVAGQEHLTAGLQGADYDTIVLLKWGTDVRADDTLIITSDGDRRLRVVVVGKTGDEAAELAACESTQ